jgi:hypothetical protein
MDILGTRQKIYLYTTMNVVMNGEAKDLRVSTITLQPEGNNNIYPFNCPGCGNFIQQIAGGKVSKIYPYYEPSSDVASISKCKLCNRRYTFQTYDGYSSEKIRVILHPEEDKEVTNFYCVRNKQHILAFTPLKVKTVADNKLHHLPFFSNCSDNYCDKVYYFAEMI